MRLSIADINRINVCGILKKNNWDHEGKPNLDPCYLFSIREILKWHFKRSNPIESESFMGSLAKYQNRYNTPHEQRILEQKAFRDYIESYFYQNLSNVHFDYLSDFKISKEDYLEYIIPVFINDVNKPTFIYYDIGKEEKQLFLQRYEVMHNAIWSFYQLNKLPTFVNIWYEDNKVHHEIYKVNEEFILKAKKNLIMIGKNLNHFIVPAPKVCQTCINIKDCERFSNKKSKKRK